MILDVNREKQTIFPPIFIFNILKLLLEYWLFLNTFSPKSLKLLNFCYILQGMRCTGSAGAQTHRSLGHHLLHPLILRLFVLCLPADFEAQSYLLQNRLHPQIQIPNACPVLSCNSISELFYYIVQQHPTTVDHLTVQENFGKRIKCRLKT